MSNSSSESQPKCTCKPLKTKGEYHFTSKHSRALEGCATGCNLAPQGWERKAHTPPAQATITRTPQITTAGPCEPSNVEALWPPDSIRTATAAQAPTPCGENFHASEFAWPRRGSCRLGKRRKHSYS